MSSEFWDGCANRRLRIKRCRSCKTCHHIAPTRCPACHSAELEWVDAGGQGRIASYTRVHRPPFAHLRERAPYVLALVDLEEGARVMGWIDGAPEDIAVGRTVRVSFEADTPPLRFTLT